MPAKVTAVHKNSLHYISKKTAKEITLLTNIGVAGDAHAGKKIKHRSRVAQNPDQPNLRQVHLIHSELHHELKAKGFYISPGQMGENITTTGIDLLSLPKATKLFIGKKAVIEITGLRNPCHQLDGIQKGLMKAVLGRDENDNLIRKAGVMGIVLQGGIVKAGDEIIVEYPTGAFIKLDRI